jgi:predicted permease
VLLSLVGGAFGLVIGAFGVRSLKQSVPADLASYLPGWNGMGIDWYVVTVVLIICVAVGIGFSLVPVYRAARTDLTGALKQGARGATGGRHVARMRSSLVIAELALAVMLLACASLLVQSFARISAARTGVQPDHVLTLTLTAPATMNATQTVVYHRAILQRLQRTPGVTGAAFINLLPLSNSNNGSNFIPDSRPDLTLMQAPNAHDEIVTPGYFATMGIPILHGRDFNETDQGMDSDSSASPVIVNRRLAERFWPGESAIGHTIRMGYEGRYRHTIVGVVGDVWYDGADNPPGPEVYHPMTGIYTTRNTDFVIRTAGDPALMAQQLAKLVAGIDPSVAVTRVMTMRAMIARHNSLYNVLANVLAIFALIATLIAAAGTYGVISYSVAQRTQEIGVRMALGAKYGTVVRMIIMDGARIAAIGLALGLVGAWFAGTTLAFVLYGIAPRDPVTLISVVVLLGAVAMLASYLPARRAGRVEPVVALRYE